MATWSSRVWHDFFQQALQKPSPALGFFAFYAGNPQGIRPSKWVTLSNGFPY
jgi:hypothetical protein